MKKVFLTFAILTGLVLSFKAYADIQSLPNKQTAPASTDILTITNALGSTTGINWTDLRHYVVTGINWQCMTPATGNANWSADATCAK